MNGLIVHRAQATHGWMYDAELLWLADRASEHRLIVELGCFVGRSTRAMADNTLGTVVAFDWFLGPTDSMGEVRYHFPKPKNQLEEFRRNLADHIASGKVVVMVGDHRRFRFDARPDMVFIDGDHKYENVVNDVDAWMHRLASGGLLCGHDVEIPDVRRAVTELLPDHQVVPATTIWYWTKPAEAPA